MTQLADNLISPAIRDGAPRPATRFACRVPVVLLVKALTVLGLVALAALAWITWDSLQAVIDALYRSVLGRCFVYCCQGLLALNVACLLWRIVLVLGYRPAAACSDAQLPACTIVVPAYNEGRGVLATLRSLASSDYPRAKLSIIAVDDGSSDDTWLWLQNAAAELGDLLQTIRLPRNRGKRHALYEGFRRSRSEVLVTVDSDSVVEPQALRRLVSPLVRQARVAAVAGNIRVLNRDEGIIPRMLDVNFAFSFDFIRASQSRVNTVMCVAGALAAYRRGPLMDVLEEWVDQTFWGRPAHIGEDRALTNLLLRDGHYCHFQRDAVCHTTVPTNYLGLCRMFLRWARSNVRETLAMGRFAFGHFRRDSALGARINLVEQVLAIFLGPVLLAASMACLTWHPGMYFIHILLGAAVTSAIPATYYALRLRDTNGLWAFPYGFFWLVLLSWINLVAALTVQKSGWLTRGKKVAGHRS